MNENVLKRGVPLSADPPALGAWGYPPSTYVSDSMIKNSMPVVMISPGYPKVQKGISLFTVEKEGAEADFRKYLANLGFTVRSFPLKFAFIADNFPTDSFSNEYGESFLQSITNIASEPIGQLAQMTGQRTASGAIRVASDMANDIGSQLNQAVGGGAMGDMVLGAIKKGGEFAANAAGKLESQGGIANVLSRLVAGERVDFPQIWKSSNHVPQYSMTIRLYNPYPGSIRATRRFIVAPLALLMTLCVPLSALETNTYSWPFFVQEAKVPGLWDLTPAIITNLTIVKGGDQQQIALNQRMGIVDVRLDISTLFAVLINSLENPQNRPTVASYLSNLLSGREVDLHGVYDAPAAMAGSKIEVAENMAFGATGYPEIGKTAQVALAQAQRSTSTTGTPEIAIDRVSGDLASISRELETQLADEGLLDYFA
jgi:hypothetical protein